MRSTGEPFTVVPVVVDGCNIRLKLYMVRVEEKRNPLSHFWAASHYGALSQKAEPSRKKRSLSQGKRPPHGDGLLAFRSKRHSIQRLKTSEPFVPPNPNEFDSA